jgi:hypothetical protein
MAKKFRGVARTVGEAKRRGHKKISNAKLTAMTASEKKNRMHFSRRDAKPGDIAWAGPCVNGNRIVCYYDPNMDPSDCRNQPC